MKREKWLQMPSLFTRQSRSVQLDSRSVCDFVARQNRRCDIGLMLTARRCSR